MPSLSDTFSLNLLKKGPEKMRDIIQAKPRFVDATSEVATSTKITVDLQECQSAHLIYPHARFVSTFYVSDTAKDVAYTNNICMKKSLLDFFDSISIYSNNENVYSSNSFLNFLNNLQLDLFALPENESDNVELEHARSNYPFWFITGAATGATEPAVAMLYAGITGATGFHLPNCNTGTGAMLAPSQNINMGLDKKTKSFAKYVSPACLDAAGANCYGYAVKINIPLVYLVPPFRDEKEEWQRIQTGLKLKLVLNLITANSSNAALMQGGGTDTVTGMALVSHAGSGILYEALELSEEQKKEVDARCRKVRQSSFSHGVLTKFYNASSSALSSTQITTSLSDPKRIHIFGTLPGALLALGSTMDFCFRLKNVRFEIDSHPVTANTLSKRALWEQTKRCFTALDERSKTGSSAMMYDEWDKVCRIMSFDLQEYWRVNELKGRDHALKITADREFATDTQTMDGYCLEEKNAIQTFEPSGGVVHWKSNQAA
jgi:hypothetical protein